MKFFAKIRRKQFNRRIENEIYQKIFAHLNGRANHGYPFDSDDKMIRLHIRNNLQAGLNLRRIGELAAKMPKAYGNAFRYIAYRDLNEFMEGIWNSPRSESTIRPGRSSLRRESNTERCVTKTETPFSRTGFIITTIL